MVGLGVMGQNLALNIDEKGFSVAGWDAWPEPVDKFAAKAAGRPRAGFKDATELVASLRRPRRIIMLVKAGEVVDKTIARCGRSSRRRHARRRRQRVLPGHRAPRQRAARRRASASSAWASPAARRARATARRMMPGGDRDGYDDLAPILTKIAAQVDDGPCVTYMRPGRRRPLRQDGAQRHRVRRHAAHRRGVRRAEGRVGGLSNAELADAFDEWNRGELQSYLIEITAQDLPHEGSRDGQATSST